MAGHSKWANIQHRKARQDAKRGKVFTKLIRAITVAARTGGSDVESNPRLRDAIDKAKAANMSNDTIERAVKKGTGELGAAQMEEVTYEGYGPGGVAVMVECLTDNRNRTVADVRHAFSKCGGNLGTDGSVSYLFKRRGQISFPHDVDEEKVMIIALDKGAEDVITNDDRTIDVITSSENFIQVRDAMLANQLNPDFAEITMIPANYITLDFDNAVKMLRLQEMLDEMDDVQNVYSNADIAEDILQKIE